MAQIPLTLYSRCTSLIAYSRPTVTTIESTDNHTKEGACERLCHKTPQAPLGGSPNDIYSAILDPNAYTKSLATHLKSDEQDERDIELTVLSQNLAAVITLPSPV